MKVAVIGSRNFKSDNEIQRRMVNLSTEYDSVTIISGGARGVDQRAAYYARLLNMQYIEIPPDFTKGYDVREYHRRNAKIVEMADKVIAFWDGESRGTESVIHVALAKRKDIEVIFDE